MHVKEIEIILLCTKISHNFEGKKVKSGASGLMLVLWYQTHLPHSNF